LSHAPQKLCYEVQETTKGCSFTVLFDMSITISSPPPTHVPPPCGQQYTHMTPNLHEQTKDCNLSDFVVTEAAAKRSHPPKKEKQ
jgi:hypothetical protein